MTGTSSIGLSCGVTREEGKKGSGRIRKIRVQEKLGVVISYSTKSWNSLVYRSAKEKFLNHCEKNMREKVLLWRIDRKNLNYSLSSR